jgi:hypothetical protein
MNQLLTGLGHLFDDPGATAVGKGLLVRFLDDLNLHGVSSYRFALVNISWSNACLTQVLDRDVDEPGAQRALLLVRFFPVVLHDSFLRSFQ